VYRIISYRIESYRWLNIVVSYRELNIVYRIVSGDKCIATALAGNILYREAILTSHSQSQSAFLYFFLIVLSFSVSDIVIHFRSLCGHLLSISIYLTRTVVFFLPPLFPPLLHLSHCGLPPQSILYWVKLMLSPCPSIKLLTAYGYYR